MYDIQVDTRIICYFVFDRITEISHFYLGLSEKPVSPSE